MGVCVRVSVHRFAPPETFTNCWLLPHMAAFALSRRRIVSFSLKPGFQWNVVKRRIPFPPNEFFISRLPPSSPPPPNSSSSSCSPSSSQFSRGIPVSAKRKKDFAQDFSFTLFNSLFSRDHKELSVHTCRRRGMGNVHRNEEV